MGSEERIYLTNRTDDIINGVHGVKCFWDNKRDGIVFGMEGVSIKDRRLGHWALGSFPLLYFFTQQAGIP